jgi:hypothetical protein
VVVDLHQIIFSSIVFSRFFSIYFGSPSHTSIYLHEGKDDGSLDLMSRELFEA